MKYLLIAIIVAGGLGSAAVAATQADSLDAYNSIIQSNIFDPNRIAPRAVGTTGPVTETVIAPSASVTLVGVAVLQGETTAVFTSATPELAGIRHAGERLGDMTVATVALSGITLTTPAGTLRLEVGSALVKSADARWQVTNAPVAAVGTAVIPNSSSSNTADGAASAAAAPASAPEASGATGGSPEDILRRMRERRQKELNP